jgi:hypothetical protein
MKKPRRITQTPAMAVEIAELAVAAGNVRRFDTFRALRICRQALDRALKDLPPKDGDLTPDELLTALRAATETDVEAALEGAYIALPITSPVEALELFNRMLDVLAGESDAAEAWDAAVIANAAGRTPED